MRKPLAIVLALAFVGAVTSLMSASAATAGSLGTVRVASTKDCAGTVGFIGPITGAAASIGDELLDWTKFAVQVHNKEYGTHYGFVQADDQFSPALDSTTAQQLASSPTVKAIVYGGSSQGAAAIGPLLGHADLAYVSGVNVESSLTDGANPTYFTTVANSSVQGPTDANYIVHVLKAKAVMIVDDQSSYSTDLAGRVQKILIKDGVSVDRESVNQQTTTDYTPIIDKLTSKTSIVFLPWQLASNAEQFGQELAVSGKHAVIFGTDGLYDYPTFNIPGSYISTFVPDIHNYKPAATLTSEYSKEYGSYSIYGPAEYVAAVVALDGMDRACVDGQIKRGAVVAAMAKTDLQTSFYKEPIIFNPNHSVKNPRYYIFRIENGKIVSLPTP